MALTGDTSGGYTGAFTFGLSASGATPSTSTGTGTTSTGGSTSTPTSTSSADTSVTVSLPYVKWRRTATGRRQLRIRVKTQETTKVVARVLRGTKTVRRTSATTVPKGTHGYTLSIPAATAAGRATLEITVKDASGNTRTMHRIVHVPAQAS